MTCIYQEPQYEEEEEEEEGVPTEVAVYNTLLETPYKDIPQLKLAEYDGGFKTQLTSLT